MNHCTLNASLLLHVIVVAPATFVKPTDTWLRLLDRCYVVSCALLAFHLVTGKVLTVSANLSSDSSPARQGIS